MSNKTRTPFWGFHTGMYVEGLRQLKTCGILMTVLFTLAGVLIPVGIALAELQSWRDGVTHTASLIPFATAHFMLPLVMFSFAPLAPLIVFGFLNKRNASDYYHALPVQRGALFTGFFAAIMTWIAIIIGVSSAGSIIATLCFPSVLKLPLTGILFPLLTTFMGSILVSAGVTLAMSITGTLFNNVLVSGLVLLVPRLFLYFVASLLSDYTAVLPDTYANPLLNFSYHIPFAAITSIFNDSPSYHNWGSVLYTALVAILYFIAAMVLFRRRGSEAAGHAAATPKLQTVYRLAITFIVTLIPIYGIIELLLGTNSVDIMDFFYILVLYLIAAVAFTVYELITTHDVKRLLKSAPSYLIVIALNAVLIGGICAGRHVVLQYTPTAEQIDAISLQTNPDRAYYLEQDAYFSKRAEKVLVTDPEVKALVAERLEKSVKRNNLLNGLYSEQKSTSLYVVTIRDGMFTRQRKLRFSASQRDIITKALAKNAAYQKIYTLPAMSDTVTASFDLLSQKDSEQVYDTLRREFNTLPFAKRYALLTQDEYNSTYPYFTNVMISVSLDRVYTFHVPLLAEHFPEAYNLYLKLRTTDTAKDRTELRENILQLKAEHLDTKSHDLYVELYTADGRSYYVNINTADQLQILTQVLPALRDEVPTYDTDWCKITYTVLEPQESTDEEFIPLIGVRHSLEAFFTLDGNTCNILRGVAEFSTDTEEVIP